MPDPSTINCPHCHEPLESEEVKRLWGQFTNSKKKLRRGPKKKLSPVQRAAIKSLAKEYPQSYIAEEYGVSASLISRIIRGER